MNSSNGNPPTFASASKRLAQRLLATGENRVELLMVEVQQERQHLLRTLLLGFGAAALGLLAAMAATVAIVVLLWATAPVATLLTLAVLYAGAAGIFYRRLLLLQKNWNAFTGTLDQLRKDRDFLERSLS